MSIFSEIYSKYQNVYKHKEMFQAIFIRQQDILM